jgi:hypothetical protein
MESVPSPETFYTMSGSSPPAGGSEAGVTAPVTYRASEQALIAFQTGGSSPPRHDRRAYVLVERPRFADPTAAQRAILVEFLADLLVAHLGRNPT